MSNENAFNKKLTAENTMDKVEGLLEHFNLPPKVIDFIRRNQKTIQIFLGIIAVAVVVFSLYDSHLEKNNEQSTTALSQAMQLEGEGKVEALQGVVDTFGSTSSAIWAQVELGHLDMKNGAYSDAAVKYSTILQETKESSPLYSLLQFSTAQAYEGEKSYDKAAAHYDLLTNHKGYEFLGYSGLARLEEAQGNIEKAIAIYNDFLLVVGDDASFSAAKQEAAAKVARLKTRL